MSETLAEKRCGPCGGGVTPYTEDAAREALKQIDPAWQLSADARSIERVFQFRDYYRVMSFVNAVAHVANTEDHHPDLSIGYTRCTVRYTTHEIRGLSENDFICAAKIDRLR
jgi:4a-hydroxytetrahydrobiopterin dehydratase